MSRVIAVVLAIIIVFSFAGCGSTGDQTTQSQSGQTGLSSSEPEDPLVYEILANVGPEDGNWEKMWFFDYVKEKFNIQFTINQVSSDGFEEKKNLAFATNTLPDVFVGSSLTANELITYGSQGQIIPLEQYFSDDLMPNFMADMKENPNVYKAHFFPDGHAYAVWGFTSNLRDYALSKFWVNTKWAQNLTGNIPATVDEFYAYLKAVKEKDANGNGDVNDEIPFGGIYNSMYDGFYDGLAPILTAFGFTDKRVQVIDGKAWLVPTHPNYKEFLKYMNKLYTEKLIDPEYFSQSEDQRVAKISQERVACFTDWAQWLYMKEEGTWQQWQSIDPLTSSFNATKMWPSTDCTLTYIFAVTKNARNVEKLMQFVDWLYTDQGNDAHWKGPEYGTWSEHPDWGWEYKGDDDKGARIIEDHWPSDKYKTINAFYHDLITPWAIPTGSLTKKASTQSVPLTEKNLTENVETHYVPYYSVGFPQTARYKQEEADKLGLLKTDLNSYIDQMVSRMIIGEISIDSEFDKFVQECIDRGGDQYMEIYQSVYDRWKSH